MTILLNFRANVQARVLSPAIFSLHSVYFRIYCLCFGFSLLFHGNHSHCQAVTLCARAQAAILRSSGHSVKEIAKLYKKTERWVYKWSKRKSFEDKPRIGWVSVLTNYTRNVIKKVKYKSNNSTRKIDKNFNITISTFLAQWYGDWPTKGGKLSSERIYHR